MNNKPIAVTFFLFFSLLFIGNIKAQNFRAGFTVGLDATDIDGADTRDYDNDYNKAGFTFGGTASAPISKKNSLQFEINYIQKGSQQKPDSMGNGFYKYAFHYIEVPVLIKHKLNFNIGKKSITHFDLMAGLSFARLIRATVQGTNVAKYTDIDGFNKNDYSAFVGFNYNFTDNFNFCFRFCNAINSVIKRTGTIVSPIYFSSTFDKGHNLVFQFTLQFTFGKTSYRIPTDKAE